VQRARLHSRPSFYQDCKTLILVGTVAAMNVDQVHRFKRFFWSRCLFDFHRTDESRARAPSVRPIRHFAFSFLIYFFSLSLSLSRLLTSSGGRTEQSSHDTKAPALPRDRVSLVGKRRLYLFLQRRRVCHFARPNMQRATIPVREGALRAETRVKQGQHVCLQRNRLLA